MKIILLLFILSLIIVEGLKYDNDDKPIDPAALLCETCKITIKEISARVDKLVPRGRKGRREGQIIEIIENICEPLNFVSYDYSPPLIREGCQIILDKFDEQLETMFLHKTPVKTITEKVCFDSKICKKKEKKEQ
jgi:hypothetical protein